MSETSGRSPPALCILGPTASGKTGLAVDLVQQLPFDIISVDSAMIYRGMDIGTAKPGPDILRIAPHRLIDFLDPAESYSAARFRDDCLREMEQIAASGRLPLLTGGTFLYLRALQRGLAPLPGADPQLRAHLDEALQRDGPAALHARLQRVDPQAAARIHPNDPQRIQRALEVYELSGRPLSAHLSAHQAEAPLDARPLLKVALAPPDRETLHRRIELRFQRMLEHGLVAEVEGLYRRPDLDLSRPAIRAVGYRQVWDYLSGACDYPTMCRRAVVATRQYAKRQLTWLRGEADVIWLTGSAEQQREQLLALIHENALVESL